MLCNIHLDDWHDRVRFAGKIALSIALSGNYKKLVLPNTWVFSADFLINLDQHMSQCRFDNPRISKGTRRCFGSATKQFPIYRTTIPFSDIEGRGDKNLYGENCVTAENGVPQLFRSRKLLRPDSLCDTCSERTASSQPNSICMRVSNPNA
jgi:hypothetical protein